MQNDEMSSKTALAALLAIILCTIPFILSRPSTNCGELCLANLKIKGTDINGVVTYGGDQINNATIDVLLNGEYKDAVMISGNMSFSAPFRLGQNMLAFSYKHQRATVNFWYFEGYTDLLAVPIGICILVLLSYISKMAAMHFTVTFYGDLTRKPKKDNVVQLMAAAKLASKKCMHMALVKDLPITSSEFAAEVCLINNTEMPLNGYGYEQAMATAAAECGLFYSDGMLLKSRDAISIAARRIYDSAIYNGNCIVNKTSSASRLLSMNKMLMSDSEYADIVNAVKKWGRARLVKTSHTQNDIFLVNKTDRAGLFLLSLCGKLEFVVL